VEPNGLPKAGPPRHGFEVDARRAGTDPAQLDVADPERPINERQHVQAPGHDVAPVLARLEGGALGGQLLELLRGDQGEVPVGADLVRVEAGAQLVPIAGEAPAGNRRSRVHRAQRQARTIGDEDRLDPGIRGHGIGLLVPDGRIAAGAARRG